MEHRLGTRQNPFMWECNGRIVPVVMHNQPDLSPYRIDPVHDISAAHIIVTSAGPFDAIDGDLLSFRHTHWDEGDRDTWNAALAQANAGSHQTFPFPARDRHQYLRECLLHLRRTRTHPRWQNILATQAARCRFTSMVHMHDARVQVEREGASAVFLQDWCRWCGQPTSRTCDGFVATYVHPYTIDAPFHQHICGAPICSACDAVFEACYRCSFWTGLPLPDPRDPLVLTEQPYSEVPPSPEPSV